MRAKKQFDGFLGNSLYERFYNANVSVDTFLEADDVEKMAYMKITHHHSPLIP